MIALFIIAGITALSAGAQTLHYSIDFQFAQEKDQRPGFPQVPKLTKRVLLPYGTEIATVRFKEKDGARRNGHFDFPITPHPRPLCDADLGTITNHTFGVGERYPASSLGEAQIIEKHGFRIAYVSLFPVQYFPATNDGTTSLGGELEIELKDSIQTLYRGTSSDREEALALADETDEIDTYPVKDAVNDVQYLVIAPQALVKNPTTSGLSGFLTEKYSRGISSEVLTIETINSQFTGSTTQQRMRNAIRSYYQNHGLKYVLLIGNGFSSAPSKTLSTSVGSVLADYYYACLDGEFTGGVEDKACEVAVGRFPASNETELQTLIQKTSLLANIDARDTRVGNTLVFGEKLDSITYGSTLVEQLVTGGHAGSVPTEGFPTASTVTKLYETSSKTYTASEVLATLNAGEFYTVNHMGHANQTYCMRFNMSSIPNLKNSLPFFGMTQGCHPGDLSASNWASKLMTQKAGGAGAMIANSGYGWYSPGSNDGPSNRHHLMFYDVVFREGLREIGKVHYRAKERLTPDMNSYIRYVIYETNLLADPELRLKF